MLKYWDETLVVLFSIIFATAYGASDCTQNELSLSYLDAAADMIRKAKVNFKPCQKVSKATDCSDVWHFGHTKSGVYSIWPKSRIIDDKPIDVYCDMETAGGGWTVIQRRGNFSRSLDFFYKDWKNYKVGFGDIEKDFWLGNDNIFSLSNQRVYSVRFDLKDVEGNRKYALYDTFWIDDEDRKYTLHIKDYSGDAGDAMTVDHDNQKFSTKDQDNDKKKNGQCALGFKSGWWFNDCFDANLNGLYHKGKDDSFDDGIIWYTFKGYNESLDTTEIKIRPKMFKRESSNTVSCQTSPDKLSGISPEKSSHRSPDESSQKPPDKSSQTSPASPAKSSDFSMTPMH